MKHLYAANVIHVMDKDNIPAITIGAGETIAVETAKPGIPDETFTKDYSVEPYPKRILSITGPIYVEGAEPGDILSVKIEDIRLDDAGKMWMGQWMGILMNEVDHCYMRKVSVENNSVVFSDTLSFPTRPMIGTLGVAPSGDPVDCLVPGTHGANMDSLSVTTGNTLYLQVNVPGALLAVGDVHAAMGYGEVLGTGIEIGSTVVMTVDVIKGRNLSCPTVETDGSFELIVSGHELSEACIAVTRKAIDFVVEHNGCSFDEAYALVGQTADLKVCQVVNPVGTVSMEIPQIVLKNKEL